MTRCDAKIRPFLDGTELVCEDEVDRGGFHGATFRDYAFFRGSATVISWSEDDRRNFRGVWAPCEERHRCHLPAQHPGRCSR